MEIGKSYYRKVSSFVESANKNPNIELEVRFWNPNYEKAEINEDKFKKIFEYYTFSKENDGLGSSYKMVSSLDICLSMEGNQYATYLDRTRLTIEDSANIKKYWIQDNLEGIPYKMIEKKKLEKLDLNDYFIRISMNEELPEEEILEKNKKQLIDLTNNVDSLLPSAPLQGAKKVVANAGTGTGNGSSRSQKMQMQKHFRLKNRYNITTADGLFMIDLTTLKSKSGKNFREANVLKESPTYEIEIEYIGNKKEGDVEEVTTKLFEHVHTIMSILNDSDFILKHAIKGRVNAAYKNLISVRRAEEIPSYSNEFRPEFICANPVTIHRVNLVKSAEKMNILNRYAVTLKADGQRMCAFVLGSDNPELNGNIYFIDINEQVIDSGLRDESCVGSLVEGEYTKLTNGKFEFYAYDILFMRGNDVRRNQYFSTYRDERMKSRSDYLAQFVGSVGRKERPGIEGTGLAIPIRRKEFKVSLKPDGMDIFERAKEVWDTRAAQPFFVDGLIFTPMFQHYPMKGGSWYELFKWKPTHLNSIDFLVETVKNNTGSEMKFPYLVNEIEKDGKIKTTLKQYKKVKLYVGTFKDAFNEKTHRMTKRKYKTLFNPYELENMDTEMAAAYYTAHIFTDENDKMICHDPITGETEPIYDDTIVEFGFDRTREKGFQWIPYRVRHDKTTSYKNGRFVFGNLDRTAYDIFRSLQYPIDDEMITTGKLPPMEENGETPVNAPYYATFKGDGAGGNDNATRLPFQNFHNHHIKLSLLKQVNEQTDGKKMVGKILDLCCGKCVDIPKMKMAMYAEVVCIDVDLDNIKFGQKYYDRVIPKPKPKAFFIRGDAGKLIFPNQDAGMSEADKLKLQSHIETKFLFDVVNVQFALHYFFENEMRLRTLLQNVNDNLKIGGYFIGTSFDGERVYNLLKGVTEVEGKDFSGNTLWKIKKQYTTKRMAFDRSKSNYGKQIDVLVRSIGNVHPEYLVNYNYLDAILEEYGFEKVMVRPFGEYYDNLLKREYEEGLDAETQKQIATAKRMSEEEQRFSFLNNAFVYRKVSNASDALFRKVVKMIEEQAKKEAKGAGEENPFVDVMDEETGHLVIAAEKVEEPEPEPEPVVEEPEPVVEEPEPVVEEPEPVVEEPEPINNEEEVPNRDDKTNDANEAPEVEQSGGKKKKSASPSAHKMVKIHPLKSEVVKRKK